VAAGSEANADLTQDVRDAGRAERHQFGGLAGKILTGLIRPPGANRGACGLISMGPADSAGSTAIRPLLCSGR
jgi:hypothetical protein